MEMLTFCFSRHGFITFMFFTTVSKGSTCEAPSSPECFRRNSSESVYICEWSTSATNSDVTFDLYFSKKKFSSIKATSWMIPEELLIRNRPVNISVEAHVNNSSCMSPKRTVELGNIVKYDAPQNISMSWSKNNLILIWSAAETAPSLAEVWFRRHEQPSESWEKMLKNTTLVTAKNSQQSLTSRCPKHGLTPENQVTAVNLTKHSMYQLQIRHRSNLVKNPLWSKWSPVVIAPAELEHEPQVNMTTKLLNGSREVTLTWKPMPHAAAEVTYRLDYTQSSHTCSCPRAAWRRLPIRTNNYTFFVPYSAVTISVTARNAAGCSPSAIVQVPAVPLENVKMCDKTSKYKRKLCKQWYEFQEPDSENVTSASTAKQEMEPLQKSQLQAYFGYMYFEHICNGGKPRTVKMCLYYKKEGAPNREPPDFNAFSGTHNSVILSWKPIPSVARRGFLTHYSLCSVKVSSPDEPAECHNISASLTKYRLENLTPGAKYSISLSGVTQVGEGPKATAAVHTGKEKRVNVWWSFGLLFAFFFITTTCTVVLKRIRNKVFPPVPTPVIPDFSSGQLEGQMLEEKEEVHELMLLQLYPEDKSLPDNADETTVFQREWDTRSDKNVENDNHDSRASGGSGDESPSSTDQALRRSREDEITDLEQLDNEIAMLIYRNGLVFDVKTDSP